MRQTKAWATALLAVALVAGCSKAPTDATVVTNIKSQMFSDSQLKNASLQVTASKGEVTLTGTVPSDAARLEAYKVAAQTQGVTKVNDKMTVEQAEAEPPQTAVAEAQPSAAPADAERASEPAHKSKSRERAKRARHTAEADAAPPVHAQAPQPEAAPAEPAPPAAPPATADSAPPPAPRPPSLQQITIPASTPVAIRMIDAVSTATDEPGEIFHASLDAPLIADGQVVVPKGADVYVRLVSASKAGRFKGKNELTLALVKLEYQGRSYPLVSDSYVDDGASQGKGTAEKVGGGAALGAIIGAIAGGGKGAAIGAAAGGGGGGVYQGLEKKKDLTIPSETKLNFQLQQPVTLSVMPRPSSAQ